MLHTVAEYKYLPPLLQVCEQELVYYIVPPIKTAQISSHSRRVNVPVAVFDELLMTDRELPFQTMENCMRYELLRQVLVYYLSQVVLVDYLESVRP